MEEEVNKPAVWTWFVGKLLFINDDLYRVTKVGEKVPGNKLIPMDVEIVEW